MNHAQLSQSIQEKRSFLCVGLDTDPRRLPVGMQANERDVLRFNRDIIEATQAYTVAYKINIAFYEAMGPQGWAILQETLQYIPEGIFTIADAKRGDIGNTAEQYARAFFEVMNFDAITLNAYMGRDAITPFLSYRDKWAIVLALTSNPGAADFQYRTDEQGIPLYLSMALAAAEWGNPDQMMLVAGANRTAELSELRTAIPQHFFLIPGVGAQGGSLTDVYTAAAASTGPCMLVNASRSILFASSGQDYAMRAGEEASRLQSEMSGLLNSGTAPYIG
jgi:orotidine-5'-phosphate decarboxylase